jgi:hypothetical protein
MLKVDDVDGEQVGSTPGVWIAEGHAILSTKSPAQRRKSKP